MELNDSKIKSIIKEYLNNPEDSKIIRKFQKEVELYIYNFPHLAYGKSLDFCSDFYLYIIERLESIIRNFPEDELDSNPNSLRFKTWFNYVLKNQLINMYHYRNKDKTIEISIDNMEHRLYLDVFGQPESDYAELRKGLSIISEMDSIILKLYYMPETINAHEIKTSAKHFNLPISTVLQIQKNLIVANYNEIQRLREITSKIGELNQKLVQVKYQVYKNKSLDIKQKNEKLLRIARMEGSRYKLIRRLDAPNKQVFEEFVNLFRNIRKAQYRLNIAKKKLKFEMVKIIKNREE